MDAGDLGMGRPRLAGLGIGLQVGITVALAGAGLWAIVAVQGSGLAGQAADQPPPPAAAERFHFTVVEPAPEAFIFIVASEAAQREFEALLRAEETVREASGESPRSGLVVVAEHDSVADAVRADAATVFGGFTAAPLVIDLR